MRKTLFPLLALCLLLSGCGGTPSADASAEFFAMDTVMQLETPGLSDPAAVTATQIKTPQGSLTLNVKTKEVKWDLSGRRDGSVVLEYMLLVGMQPVSALRVSLFLRK